MAHKASAPPRGGSLTRTAGPRTTTERCRRLLAKLSMMLVRSGDPAVAVGHVLPDLQEAFGAAIYLNYVLEGDDPGRLVLDSSIGLAAADREAHGLVRLGEGLHGEVARTRGGIILADVQALTDPASARVRALGVTAFACHPLVADDRLLGTLAFMSTTHRDFAPAAVATMRDISDYVAAAIARTRLLRALYEEDASMRRALRAARIGTWHWRVASDTVVTSPGYESLLHGREGVALHSSAGWLDAVHPEDRARLAEVHQRAVAGGLSQDDGEYRVEYRVVMPGGAIRWLRSHGKVITTLPAGAATQICGATVDVTEQWDASGPPPGVEEELLAAMRELERREQEVRTQATNLAALPATAPVGLATVDRNMRFTAVNDHYAECMDLPASQMIGRTLRELAPAVAEVIEPLQHDVLNHSATIVARELSYPSPGRPGIERIWLQNFYPLQDGGGQITGVGQAVVDITEQRRLDDKQRHAERLQTVGRLAAGVAHDFNNILHIVIGNLDLLDDAVTNNEQSRALVTMAIRAAQRGAYLTQQMLSYTRQQLLVPKRLVVTEVFSAVRLLLERALGPRIKLDVVVPGPVADVIADRAQLETALINLGINAGQAMPAGGSIRFEVFETEGAFFGEIKPGRHVVIATVDTGSGIPPDVLDKVFEPFFTTKGLDGTGLGLSMVQGFSRQSGGDTRVFSTPGKGTRVEIWLPAAAAPPGAGSAPTARGHVLLVDDMSDALITTAAFLERDGFRVQRASGASEAMTMIAAGMPVDVLITDYMMPGMNGVDLVDQIRVYRPLLPALIITGFAEIIDYVPESHGTALLRKPFKRERLVKQIEALIGVRRPVS